MRFNYEKYCGSYTDKKLFEKVGVFSAIAGKKLVYMVLLFYFTLQKKDIPKKSKALLIGSLGYFIAPFDLIPDFIPFLGYTDDFASFMMALAVVSAYIDEEVKQQARTQLESWFGTVNDSELEEVNGKL